MSSQFSEAPLGGMTDFIIISSIWANFYLNISIKNMMKAVIFLSSQAEMSLFLIKR
jgi:hypothetical protein